MHTEVCPVCHGEGTVPVNPNGLITSSNERKTCHACNGNGYLFVPDEHYWPVDPYYPPSPPFLPFYVDPQYPVYFCCMVIPSD